MDSHFKYSDKRRTTVWWVSPWFFREQRSLTSLIASYLLAACHDSSASLGGRWEVSSGIDHSVFYILADKRIHPTHSIRNRIFSIQVSSPKSDPSQTPKFLICLRNRSSKSDSHPNVLSAVIRSILFVKKSKEFNEYYWALNLKRDN